MPVVLNSMSLEEILHLFRKYKTVMQETAKFR
jgi:hypothetical protein